MPIIDANGAELYYEDRGRGAPVLFVQAVGAGVGEWAPLVDRLQGQMRCVSYERRGYPRSPRPAGETGTVAGGADDIAALIDALGLAPCALVGASWGCMLCLDALRRHADRISGVAFGEPTIPALDPTGAAAVFTRLLPGVGAALAKQDFREAVDALHAELSGGYWATLDEARKEAVRAVGPGLAYDFLMPAYEVQPADLRTIARPCEVILGSESDPFFQSVGRTLAKYLSGCGLSVLDGVGHSVFAEAPERCAEILVRFRRRLADGPAN